MKAMRSPHLPLRGKLRNGPQAFGFSSICESCQASLTTNTQPPPPRKAALLMVTVMEAIIMGFDIYHPKTLREQKAG